MRLKQSLGNFSLSQWVEYGIIAIFLLVVGWFYLQDLSAGKEIGKQALSFGGHILTILPCAFVLIGLFEVWVDKELIETHLGHESGIKGHFWSVALAGTTVGGLYVAFPVAASLYRNGARPAVIFSYIGASGVVRIPMTIFEASFLGIEFSLIRLLVSLPLVLLSAELLAYITRDSKTIFSEKQGRR